MRKQEQAKPSEQELDAILEVTVRVTLEVKKIFWGTPYHDIVYTSTVPYSYNVRYS